MENIFILNPNASLIDLQDAIASRLSKADAISFFIYTALFEEIHPADYLTANAVLVTNGLIEEIKILHCELFKKINPD